MCSWASEKQSSAGWVVNGRSWWARWRLRSASQRAPRAVPITRPSPPVPALARTTPRSPGTFRDLNHNGQLDPYEDSRLTPEARADDLVKRMTLEEKAGAMMHDTLPGLGADGGLRAGLQLQGH